MTFVFPFTALIKRELVTKLRSRWLIFCVAAVVGLAIAVVLAAWPDPNVSLSNLSFISRLVLTGFIGVLFLSCAFLVPGIAGSAMTLEKETKTLDLLRLTLMRPAGLVAGKLFNVVALFLLIIVAVLPVLGCIVFLAGVDWMQLIWCALVIVGCSFSVASFGIMCSTLFRRTQTAIVVSYVGLLAFMGGLAVPVAWVESLLGLERAWGLNLAYYLEIAVPLHVILNYSSTDAWQLAGAVGFQAFFAFISFLICLRILGRPPKPAQKAGQKLIHDEELLRQRRQRFPYYLIDPGAGHKPIADKSNPMLLKELRWGFVSRTPTLIRSFYISFLLFLLPSLLHIVGYYYSASSLSLSARLFVLLTYEIILILAVAPALSAAALSKEYELKNLDMLRMTLLTPWEIIQGKLFSGIVSTAPLLGAAVITSVVVWLITEPHLYSLSLLITGYVTLIVCVFLSLSIGLFASLVTRRTGVSIVLSYGLNLVAFAGILILGTIVSEALDLDLSGTTLGYLSPVAGFIENVPDPYAKGLKTHSITAYWCRVELMYFLLGCALTAATVKGFLKYRMRDR